MPGLAQAIERDFGAVLPVDDWVKAEEAGDGSGLLGRSAAVADADNAPRLRGVFCASAEEGSAAARGGADFLVMRDVLADEELEALCRTVSVPVYAPGVALEKAWELGASGLSEI